MAEVPINNSIHDGVHHSDGPQFNQSSINSFHYHQTSTSDPSQAVWTVPRSVNRLYTGRQDIAEKLARAFPSTTTPTTSQRRFVIAGLGGTGKSEVCLKFAFDHENDYWGVFWIDCSSESSAEQDFTRIGHHCRLQEPSLAAVKDYLSTVQQKWLLLLDNADDPAEDYSAYFPTRDVGDIIITTRNEPLTSIYQTVGFHLLDQLDLELATELLLRATKIPEQHWPAKQEKATELVTALGRHTLAIRHAAAFIEEGSCQIEEYMDIYSKHRDHLYKFQPDQERSVYGTVHTTFEVSVARLQLDKDAGHTDARDALKLLDLLAFMHFQGKVELILKEATSHASKIMNKEVAAKHPVDVTQIHAVQLPSFFPSKHGAESNFRWRRACRKLMAFSFIRTDFDDGCQVIVIHPLVHSWLKDRQTIESQSDSWFTVSSALALSCANEDGWHPIVEQAHSHIRACFGNEFEGYLRFFHPEAISPILYRPAWVLLCHLCDDYKADLLIELLETNMRASRKSEIKHKRSIEYILLGVNKLRAELAEIRDDISLELDLRHDIVKICEKELEEEDDDDWLFSAQDSLACAYVRNGQVQEGIQLYQHVIKKLESKGDMGNPELLMAQNDLAEAYQEDGQVQKAIELFEYVVKMRDAKLDEAHPDRLVSQHELAGAYLEDGQVQKAINLYEHVVKIEETKLDEGRQDRLVTQHELARALLANEQVQEAIQLFEHVVSVEREHLSSEDPSRLVSMEKLAEAYKRNGRIEDARKIQKEIAELEFARAENSSEVEWRRAVLSRDDDKIHEVVNSREQTLRNEGSDGVNSPRSPAEYIEEVGKPHDATVRNFFKQVAEYVWQWLDSKIYLDYKRILHT